MASVNKCILVGNLCADVEVKSFQNGGRIANLRIATNESWKDKNTGERKERVEYHSVTISGDGLVGVAEKYLRKGSKVYVEGQLRTRKWQDQSGQDRYSTEVMVGGIGGSLVMLDGAPPGERGGGQRDSGGRSSGTQRDGGRQQSRDTGGWGASGGSNRDSKDDFYDDLDDDIPF